MESLFMLMMGVSGLSLFVAILTALIAIFSSDEDSKHNLNSVSAKSVLVFSLTFVVGFGACVGMI